MTLLIVDDSAAFRERLRRYLTELGSVEIIGEAADGLEALEAITRFRPEVVLLDLHMPGADGFAVLREVKTRFASTRVVILTGDESLVSRERCMRLGADAVLDKLDASTHLLATLGGL